MISHIFRKYDIRGDSVNEITEEIAYKIGFYFAKLYLSKKSEIKKICVIGRDARLSSPKLCNAFIKGLKEAERIYVISIGVCSTPMLYFADKKFKPMASIMVTASHNPKNDNGFKIILEGKSFFAAHIKKLGKEVIKSRNKIPYSDKNIILDKEINIKEQYIDIIIKNQYIDHNLKIAWDFSNGSAGYLVQYLKQLPNKNFFINTEVDGNFPGHSPDPSNPENLKELTNIVKKEKCHFGFIFDGDADRVCVINSQGELISADKLICLFAQDILKNNPKAKIIADIKTSEIVFNEVKKYGGNAIIWKTGHCFIKEKMRSSKALLAGEMSGHFFFADRYYGYDDGLYAALRLIDLISKAGQEIEKLISCLPVSYNTREIKIFIGEKEKISIIKEIKKQLQQAGKNFVAIDGIKLYNENGWWLIRSSNTEAAIVIRCESFSQNGLIELKKEINNILEKFALKIEL